MFSPTTGTTSHHLPSYPTHVSQMACAFCCVFLCVSSPTETPKQHYPIELCVMRNISGSVLCNTVNQLRVLKMWLVQVKNRNSNLTLFEITVCGKVTSISTTPLSKYEFLNENSYNLALCLQQMGRRKYMTNSYVTITHHGSKLSLPVYMTQEKNR